MGLNSSALGASSDNLMRKALEMGLNSSAIGELKDNLAAFISN